MARRCWSGRKARIRIKSSSESGDRRSLPVLRDVTRGVDERGDGSRLEEPVVRSLLDAGAVEGGLEASAGSASPGLRRFIDGILMWLLVSVATRLRLGASSRCGSANDALLLAKPAEGASQPVCGFNRFEVRGC